jgi:hypothetical protein
MYEYSNIFPILYFCIWDHRKTNLTFYDVFSELRFMFTALQIKYTWDATPLYYVTTDHPDMSVFPIAKFPYSRFFSHSNAPCGRGNFSDITVQPVYTFCSGVLVWIDVLNVWRCVNICKQIVTTVMRFQVLTVLIVKRTVVWDVMPCSLVEIYRLSEERIASAFRVKSRMVCLLIACSAYSCPEDSANKFLRNFGNVLPDYTASYPMRLQSSVIRVISIYEVRNSDSFTLVGMYASGLEYCGVLSGFLRRDESRCVSIGRRHFSAFPGHSMRTS